MSVPVPASVRARIIDLHDKGVGRNDIARLCEVSTATVSRVVKAAGGTFDTRQTEMATRNRVADLAERRSRLADRLITKAHDLMDDMDLPFIAFNFGGKDNTYEEHQLPKAPPEAVHKLMLSVRLAQQASMDLTRFDADPSEGLSAVDQWIAHVTGVGTGDAS